MPTFERTRRFRRDLRKLTSEQQAMLEAALRLRDALAAGDLAPAGLRVKGVTGFDGVFELTWAEDGRATFTLGPQRRPGHARVVWRDLLTQLKR